jgi:hypothetical protein
VDQAQHAEVERASAAYARAAAWMARAAAISAAPSRPAAAQQLVALVMEATAATGAAVYLVAGDPAKLTRGAASPALEGLPSVGTEATLLDLARDGRLLVVPLMVGSTRAGHLLLAEPTVISEQGRDVPGERASAGPPMDGLIKLLATQAASAFLLLTEREKSVGAAMKDPASSAYSFAYYVDVAGREIDKARRYARRFAVAVVTFETGEDGKPPPLSHAEVADQLLKAARDTDVVAHIDEHEFHMLMPETDGLGAHAARRRILARIAERLGKAFPPGLLVGVSTFPHDGNDLSQLLRAARRRADATRGSIVRRLSAGGTSLVEIVDALSWELEAPSLTAIYSARPIDLPSSAAAAVGAAVVADAVRGGSTIVVVTQHQGLGVGASLRAVIPAQRDNVTLHTVDVRPAIPGEDLEALAVLAAHGAYAFIARHAQGAMRGLHAAGPLLTDLLAERLGRAAGLRLFN